MQIIPQTAQPATDCSPVLIAPDGSTSFKQSSIPTAEQIADWCHPRSNPDRWLRASVETPRPSVPHRLLGIWAHPDDEAYLSAGLMSRVAAAGGHVTVVAITDGEAGFPAEDVRPPGERAAQRRRELQAAMAIIGVRDLRFFGVADGALADAPKDALVHRIAAVIQEVNPDVIVTFGPDGITGHSDHVANSRLVTSAWSDVQIGELWYAAKTEDWLNEWRDLHDDFGVWMTGEPTGVRAEDVETVIEVDGAELDTKRAVLAEHRSQTEGLAAAFGEDRYRSWIREEAFRQPSASELTSQSRLVGSVSS